MTIINQTQEATIDTVTPVLSLGQIQLRADRRSTASKPVADSERIRRVVLPAGHWGDISATLSGEFSQSLTDCLRAALRTIGGERLADSLEENPLLRTVALGDYTVTALLTWNADSAATRGSITFTREQVETWYATSTIGKKLAAKAGKLVADKVGKRLAVLSAKNHGLKSEADCNSLTAMLAGDTDSALVGEILGRLEGIAKGYRIKAAEPAELTLEQIEQMMAAG